MIPALLPLALLAAVGQATPAAESDDAVYRRRHAAVMAKTDIYDVMEPIAGKPGAPSLPVAGRRTLSAATLAGMRNYAFTENSSALLVWRNGKLEAQDYAPGTGADTLLNAKSLAKPLAAIAVGRAIQLGAITSLDQHAVDFIPEWRGTPKAAITIRQLLSMTAGLLDQGPTTDPKSIWARSYLDPHHDRILVEEYPLAAAPGTQFGYCNASIELAALIVERATKRRYAAFLSDEVLAPIGAAGGKIWIDRPGGLAHAGCCSLLPAQTWLRLGLLLIDDGVAGGKRLLPPGYVTQMRTGTVANPRYGLSVWLPGDYIRRRGFGRPDQLAGAVLHSEPYLAKDLFLFDGNGNQVLYMIPSQRLAILRMGDYPSKGEWDNSILPNMALGDLDKAR